MAKEDDKKLTLYSGQTSETSQQQTSESESTRQSTQTQRTVLDQEGTEAARKALDPFYRRAEEEGAVRAFLDTYAKPDPADAERAERAARAKKQAAVLAESLRLISDMGAGFAGGNVYDRRGAASKSVAAAKDDADRAQERYRKELERFNAGLLSARQADIARRDALDRLALQYGTRTESTSEGKGSSSSSSQGNSKSEGTGWQQQQARAGSYGRSNGRGAGTKYRTIYRPRLADGGKMIGRTAIDISEDRWEDLLRANADVILKNPALRKRAVERAANLGVTIEETDLPDILLEGKLPSAGGSGQDMGGLREALLTDIDYNNREMMDILSAYTDSTALMPPEIVEWENEPTGNRKVKMPGTAPAQTHGGTAAAQTDFSFPD